jgi:hypothetical protein
MHLLLPDPGPHVNPISLQGDLPNRSSCAWDVIGHRRCPLANREIRQLETPALEPYGERRSPAYYRLTGLGFDRVDGPLRATL